MSRSHKKQTKKVVAFSYDPWILFSAVSLIGLGLIMVASSSVVISDQQHGHGFYYVTRQAIFLSLGCFFALVATRIPLKFWMQVGGYLVIISFILLLVLLIPGLGREVNGSVRWLALGPFSLQVSELAKVFMVIYLAGYMVRQQDEVKTRIRGFIKPLLILAGIAFLFLLQPDFGATAVLTATMLAMLFLGGVRLWQFICLLIVAAAVLAVVAISEPYRLLRLTTFLHPWENPYDTGYQLTQSLIAFGRGGVFGLGLGGSVQKLFYLPEAHTDFLFAVLGEELGLIGQISVVLLFGVLIMRTMLLSLRSYTKGQLFSAYLGWGLALCLGLQAMINIGVNIGLLPTKGLTLPLMSYGGTSLLVNCFVVGILLRVAFESGYIGRRK
jgi:cell division protein FtsW